MLCCASLQAYKERTNAATVLGLFSSFFWWGGGGGGGHSTS